MKNRIRQEPIQLCVSRDLDSITHYMYIFYSFHQLVYISYWIFPYQQERDLLIILAWMNKFF